MRQVILDTETTGLSWERGNRVVEIGCVEFIDRRPTNRTFHCYLKPDRDFEPGAAEVTGLTLEFLADKPQFIEVVEDFLAFIEGAELVIHNAAFDVGFLDNELRRAGSHFGKLADRCAIEDSLLLARQRFPGQRNSLDALCKRLGVDNAHRQLHGALLDAQLLAEVYIGLTSGQDELGLGSSSADSAAATAPRYRVDHTVARPRVVIDEQDRYAHEARLTSLRKAAGHAIWDSAMQDDTAELATG